MVLFVAIYCASGTNSSDFLQCFAYSWGERTGSCEVLFHRRGAVLHIRQPVLRWNTPIIDIMSDSDIRSADLHYKGTVPAKLCVCGRMWLDVLVYVIQCTLQCCFELGPIGSDRRPRETENHLYVRVLARWLPNFNRVVRCTIHTNHIKCGDCKNRRYQIFNSSESTEGSDKNFVYLVTYITIWYMYN